MVKSTIFAIFTVSLAALANAYTVADYTNPNPSGNAIQTPVTGGSVEAGKDFTITWTPSSGGTVTIYLCKGPSTNCVNEAVPLADKVTNSGSFVWAVPTTLEASSVATQGYGIQLISDQTPTIYQWSGQFGILNSNPQTSASASASASVASSSVGTPSASASAVSSSSVGYPVGSSSTAKATSASPSVTKSAPGTVGTVVATGGSNSTVIQPTKPLTVPSSLKTSATAAGTGSGASTTTTGGVAISTGAAGMVQVGFGALFGGVVAALAL